MHIDTGRYYAAKVINKRLMSGREHMVCAGRTPTTGDKSMADLFSNIQVRNEIAVLKKVSLGHQNILTLVDYFETMNNCVSPSSMIATSATPLTSDAV